MIHILKETIFSVFWDIENKLSWKFSIVWSAVLIILHEILYCLPCSEEGVLRRFFHDFNNKMRSFNLINFEFFVTWELDFNFEGCSSHGQWLDWSFFGSKSVKWWPNHIFVFAFWSSAIQKTLGHINVVFKHWSRLWPDEWKIRRASPLL